MERGSPQWDTGSCLPHGTSLWHCSHHPLSPTEPKLMAKIKEDKKVAGTFIILGVERDVYSFLSEVVPLW